MINPHLFLSAAEKACWKKKKKTRIYIPIYSSIRNFLDEEHHIPVKRIEIFDDTYIQYDSDGDTYVKVLLSKEYLEKMKTDFIDIVEELKNTRPSLKIKSIVALVFKYNRDDKRGETEIFIHSIN